MLTDEFQSLERYTRELEALRLYPQVRRERDSLAREVSQLRERVGQLERELKGAVSARKELASGLKAKEAEATEMAEKLGQAQMELSELKDFKAKVAGGDDLSLEEMRVLFLHAEEREIENQVKERSMELEKDLGRRTPALVYQRLVAVLKSPRWPPEIAKAIDARAKQMADSTLRDTEKWPDWFKDYYLHQVKEAVSRGLDSEFESGVQAEAQKRLDTMKAGQWEKYTAAKARGLAVDLKGLVSQLQGTWWSSCDRCGRRLAVDIGPSEIGGLLGGRTVDVVCSSCTDPAPFPLILSTVPHKVGTLSLEGLVRLYVGGPPTTG